jgi:hypothetical protein
MSSTQILVGIKLKVVITYFEVDTKICMVDIINMKVSLMEVDEKTLEEGEVIETVVEVIKVNNQTMIQISITMGNLGTWQIIVIKRCMMH